MSINDQQHIIISRYIQYQDIKQNENVFAKLSIKMA